MEHIQQLNSIWSVVFALGTFVAMLAGIFWKQVGQGARLDDHKQRIKVLEDARNHEAVDNANRLTKIEVTQQNQTITLEKIDKKLDRLAEDGCYRANEFHGDKK